LSGRVDFDIFVLCKRGLIAEYALSMSYSPGPADDLIGCYLRVRLIVIGEELRVNSGSAPG